jgi:hypothetical protein
MGAEILLIWPITPDDGRVGVCVGIRRQASTRRGLHAFTEKPKGGRQ